MVTVSRRYDEVAIAARQTYREVFDRGVDELLLHAACLDGQLFEFCSSFFSNWDENDREYFQGLMRNPYPLDPRLALAGLIAKNVVTCKRSDEEFVRRKMEAEGNEAVLSVIEDYMEQDELRLTAEKNSYWLEGDSQKFRGESIGEVQLGPEESRKSALVYRVDPGTGGETEILMLAPEA